MAISLICTTPVLAADFPITTLPKSPSEVDAFRPPHWQFEHKIQTNLNGDKLKDLVVTFQSDEYTPKDGVPTRDRALVVLLGCPNNKFQLTDYNTKLLLCTTCGGQLGADIEINPLKDSFQVEQMSGGGTDQFVSDYTFAYDEKTKTCILVKAQQDDNFDRVGGSGTRLSLDFKSGVATINHYTSAHEKKQTKQVRTKQFFLSDLEEGKFDLGKILNVKFH